MSKVEVPGYYERRMFPRSSPWGRPSWEVLQQEIVVAGFAFERQVADRLNSQMAQQLRNSHSKAASTWIDIPCAAAQEAKNIVQESVQAYLGIKSAV